MKKIDITEIAKSPVELIGKQWMLITAGTPEAFNCMTASWGGIGFLWNRPVAFVFVRPNRHTVNFIEEQPSFTLSFMPEQYRQDLVFCGRNSGRDVDKMTHTSLKPYKKYCLPGFHEASFPHSAHPVPLNNFLP